MATQPPAPSDVDWEKTNAPPVSAALYYGVMAAFDLFLLFLLAMAIHRWVITLQ